MRVVALLFVFVSAGASAQTADTPASDTTVAPPGRARGAWLSLSPFVGRYLAPSPSWSAGVDVLGIRGDLNVPLGSSPILVQVGASTATELFRTSFTEAHVAVGSSVSSGPLFFSAAVGPSFTRAIPSVGSRSDAATAFGTAVGAQAQVAVFPLLAIGVEGTAILNRVQSVTGLGINLSFGRFSNALFPDPLPVARRPASESGP